MDRMIKPYAVRIEASTFCQLKCPCCPRTRGVIENAFIPADCGHPAISESEFLNPWAAHEGLARPRPLGLGSLPLENFKKVIDDNRWIRHVELSNWGEMFLNPQIAGIMAYARKRGVILTADNGVNLNTAGELALEALVKYRFTSFSCSINGTTQDVYGRYCAGGNLDTVLANVLKINAYKKRYNSGFPLLHWQFVIFGHNEHQITAARAMAKKLGMYFMLRLNVSGKYSPVNDTESVKKETLGRYASRKEYFQKNKIVNRQKVICSQLWNSPQLNWDGRLLGCCVNYWGDFGDAFKDGIVSCLQNESIAYARSMLLGKAPARSGIICTDCIYYKIMKDTGNWLTPSEIWAYKAMYRAKYAFMRAFAVYPLPDRYCT